MAAEKPDIHDIFNKAIARDSDEERERYLDSACGNDLKLRTRVEALLRAHSEAGGFFGGQSPAPEATEIGSATEHLGETIGPYKLLEQIGEGGFGIVYMADQQAPVRRRVALKIIKPGMDTKQVLARFQAELLALSLMDHPNIARALDAGSTDSGRPYFVMELVRGVPITEYCDQNNLPVHERLDLFVNVCHAVQHAHQKGIIHRDIKPSNVLVTMQDGRPVPKVIDFGVAKAIDRQLTQETIFTRFAEMIGTPLYMSPEQAEMTSLDIDTRSDVYSLGVLLYELLTGTTPFEKERLKQAAFDEIRRIIREEEPAKPSTRISTLGDISAAVAAHRHAEPHRLGQLMRGDLDWIVMKALEKDRTRRYETANGLAMDLQRHLANEPVLAGPPSAAYRFRKFARRNRVALAMIVIVTAALLLGIVGTTWQAIQAGKERENALHERDHAVDAESLAQERLESERNARAAEAQQRQIAEAQKAEAEKMRLQAEANFRKARQAVDEYFTLVSESKLLDVPGLQPLRKQLLEAAQRYYQDFLNQKSSDPNVRTELAATCLRVAQVEMQNDRTDDSIQSLKRGLTIVEVLLHEKPRIADLKQVAGFRRTGRVLQFWELWPSDPPEAMRVTQQAIEIWEQLVREYPDVDGFQSDLATFYHYLGDLKVLTMDRTGALHLFQKACADWDQLLARHPNDPEYRRGLADDLEYAAGQPPQPTEKKEAAFRRALTLHEGLVAEFPGVPEYRAGLANGISRFGNYLSGENRLEESEVLQRRALELWEKLVADYPMFPGYRKRLADRYATLSHALIMTGRPQEAEKRLRQAVDVMAKLAAESPGEHGDHLRGLEEAQFELVRFLSGAGRMKEAEAVWHDQVAATETLDKLAVGKPDWQHEVGHGNRCLAGSAQELGLLPETEQALQKALTVFQKLPAGGASELDPRFFLADTYRLLGNVLAAEHRPAEAEKAYGRAIEIHEMASGESLWEPLDESAWAASFLDFARFLKSTGRLRESEPTYQRLIARAKTLAVAFPDKPAYRERLTRTQLELPRVLKETGRLNEAVEVLTKIAAESSGEGGECLVPLAEARNQLVSELQAAGRLKEAEAALHDQAAVLARLQKSATNNPKLQLALGHAYRYLGAGEWSPDLLQDAEQSYRQAIAMFEQASASDPSNLEHRHFLADTHRILGHLLVSGKRPEQAEKEFRRAIEIHETTAGKPPIEPRNEAEWATCYLDFARFLESLDRPREAEDVFRRLLSQAEALLVTFPGKTAYRERRENTYLKLGQFLSNHQQPVEADKAYSRLLELNPKSAVGHNNQAWLLATCVDSKFRDPARAVTLAEKAVELEPKSGYIWDTLGIAHYRAGDWKAALAALEKSMELRKGGDSVDWFFLAMAHWQLGQKDEARKWFHQAIEWMDKNKPTDDELIRFRTEAAQLLEIKDGGRSETSKEVPMPKR